MDKFVIVNICNPGDTETLKTLINLSNVEYISEGAGKGGDGQIVNIIKFKSQSSIGIKESIDEICKNAFSFDPE